MMFDLSCATPMRTHLRLSLHVEILITDNIRLSLRNLESFYMTVLLALSPLSVAYVLVVILLILIMNVLNNFSIRLMILFESIVSSICSYSLLILLPV
jgi:hypothetical protein